MTKAVVRKLTDLVPDARNANRGTERGLRLLDDSLREDGAGRGILLDRNGNVIAGNKTLERAVDQGFEKVIIVPTDGSELVATQRIDVDLDTPQGRRMSLRDNRVAEVDLDFDPDVLKEYAESGVDLATLWNEDELAELMAGVDGGEPPGDPGAQIDRAEELQQKWQVKPGDVWEIGKHRLLCGDSTRSEDVARVMDGDVADLGLTSPPYAVGKEYELNISFSEHLAMLRNIADRALEFIKPGGFFFINFGEIAAQSHTKSLTGSDRQCLYLISADYWQIFHIERKFDLYAQRIWYKPFNRLQQPFWTYHTSIPHYQEWEHIWTWRLPGGDGDMVFDWDISVRAVWDTRDESTDDKPLTRHSAAFPVGIPERAIRAHSERGAIVWEPFLGSGTTLVACEQTGRQGRGIEIEPKYCAVTLEWLAQMGLEPRRM